MPTLNRFILALYVGTLSVGTDRILVGDAQLALAAHHYYDQYGLQQDLVRIYKPKSIEYGYADLGGLYQIVGYEVRDIEMLEDWWYGSN